MEHRTLADTIVLVALGTFLVTDATLLRAARNPDRHLPWSMRRMDLVDGDVARTLRIVGVVATVWGGTGLERRVGLPLAPPLALGPAVLLGLGVRWHHRRLAGAQAGSSSPSSSR